MTKKRVRDIECPFCFATGLVVPERDHLLCRHCWRQFTYNLEPYEPTPEELLYETFHDNPELLAYWESTWDSD